MSLKIERDTFQQGPGPGPSSLPKALKGAKGDGVLPGTSGDHPLAEKLGTALTGGKDNAGTKGYLAVRSASQGPLRRWTWVLTVRRRARPTSSSSRRTRCGPRC